MVGTAPYFLMPNITFPAQFEFLDEIREFVGQVAGEGGFSEKEIYSIQLASDEAASNIIEHAYEGISNADIDITCNMRGKSLVITMHDTGGSFDPSVVKQPDLKADLSERQIGGLGVYLMRKLMDEVRYESNPKTGNLLTLIKRRG
jgi:anti-sigma regulatory factor (Ser/Thr protein kinase)